MVKVSITNQKRTIPEAEQARARMIEREEHRSVANAVFEALGGNNAAQREVEETRRLHKRIMETGKTSHNPGSLAEAARNKMIERNKIKNREKGQEDFLDVGRDNANRHAYPKDARRTEKK